jgi:hypothetical protein
MAEYIEKGKLKSDLLVLKDRIEPNTQWQDGYISAMDVTRQEVDSQPIADVIEWEKIDKAIEEIKGLIKGSKLPTVNIYNRYSEGLEDCLEILKRNIGENE